MMDEKRMKVVVCVVVVLVLLSIGTDFGADVVRGIYYKEHEHYTRRLVASLLEIIAAVALAIARAIIDVETECPPVPRQLNVNWNAIAMLICFCFSWFTFANAFRLFITSALFDLGYFRHIIKVKPSGAALSSFCYAAFDVVYYIVYSVNTTSSTAQVIPPSQADIELGQPQLPPINC